MDDELVLSHFTLGRHRDFRERVAAAAGAGFSSMGFYLGDYERLRALGHSDADLRAVLAHHGVTVVELEALRGWCTEGAAREHYLAAEARLLAMADAFGTARTVQVIGPYDGTRDEAAAAFAGLCDRLAEHGLKAAIEFLPEMSNIPDAATALDVVQRAGRPNGGLCVDTWHHFRGAADDDMLRQVPVDRWFVVQFCDGPSRPADGDYYTDCTHNRLPPGEGDFRLLDFLRLLDDIGVDLPLSVEVLSDDLLALPAAEAARKVAAATRRVLAAARREEACL